MLESLVAGFVSLWVGNGKVQVLKSADWSGWIDASWIQSLGQPEFAIDPATMANVQQHLNALTSLGMAEPDQGVWIQAGNQVLADHQGGVPLSAASLTKIATTLVALDTWGLDYQFETLVGATAPIEAGVVQGDLVIQGGGDPFFVWEEAIALGNALNQRGITRVMGNLVIAGNFAMNFQTDPATAGRILKQGLNAALWNGEAAAQFDALPPGTPRPQVIVDGTVEVISLAEATNWVTLPLVRHRSLPLSQILKALNTYSNNVMSDSLAMQLGGAQIVAQKAAELARVPSKDIQLINGSGLGVDNRLSPRSVCAMLIAIQNDLKSHQLNVADLFPVIGLDRGTLGGRRIPLGSAVKTGTLNTVSSLAGVIPTRDRGPVWFTIINVGTANLDTLHNEQDKLVQRLQDQWGNPSPLPGAITPGDRGNQPGNQLGAPSRNEILR